MRREGTCRNSCIHTRSFYSKVCIYTCTQINVYHVLHIKNSSFTCKYCTDQEMKISQIIFPLHVASVALLLALASGYAVVDQSSECPTGTIILLDHITVSAAQPCRVASCVLMIECISVLTTS